MTAKIPKAERELVGDELVYIADRLVKKCKLTVPEARHAICEILGVSV